jgi:hypothetical protein
LAHNYRGHPNVMNADVSLMNKAEDSLRKLIHVAQRHSSSNTLLQFVLSHQTQLLIDEASRHFSEAINKLHLNIAVTHIGVSLRIDENVAQLLS